MPGANSKLPRRPKQNDVHQHDRFIEAAKKSGADESPDALDRAFKKLDTRAVKKFASRK
jgi:hypothetical protein